MEQYSFHNGNTAFNFILYKGVVIIYGGGGVNGENKD
jgi:hypothetical protein